MPSRPKNHPVEGTKKRILIVARNLKIGGIQKVAVNLSGALADEGHETHVLLYKDVVEFDLDPRVHLHVRDLDKRNRYTVAGWLYDVISKLFLKPLVPKSGFLWKTLYYTPLFRLAVKRLERDIGAPFDLIIFRGQGSYDVNWAYRDPRACFVVENVPTMLDERDSRYKQAVDRFFYRILWNGKRLVTVSSDLNKRVREKCDLAGARPESVTTVYNPCPIRAIRRQASEPAPVPDTPYAVHVSRLVPQKNQSLLLHAFKQSGIAAKLVIVGKGKDERKLKELSKELGISDRVVFVGQKTNPYPWMKHANLFILSSRIEGFGMVLAESLICGTPVVSTDCQAGVRDVLIEEQAEFIAGMDKASLAEKIRQAWDNPPPIRERWVERFDARTIARRFAEVAPPPAQVR